MKKEKLEYFAYFVIAAAGFVAFAFIFFRYVFGAILPFLLGWFAAFASRGPAQKLARKTRIPGRVWRLIIAAVVTLSVLSLVFIFLRMLFSELWNFLSGLGEGDTLGSIVDRISEEIFGIFGRLKLPAGIESSITDALNNAVTSLLSSLGGVLTAAASMIPKMLFFVVITVISAIYFSLDLEKINSAVKRILPAPFFDVLVKIKNGVLSLVAKYLRSYFLIMLITFSIMLVGFLILNVDYAFLFALVISVLDLLPVIGVGTALVPASVLCFLAGNRGLGIGLLILLAVNEIVRQLTEPKILGKHLGVHPLITLAVMYIGYSFFGFAGLFLLPLSVVIFEIFGNKNNSPEVP